VIICEGPDGSGKSTLAARIADDIGWELLHSGGPQKSDAEMKHRIKTFLNRYTQRTVYDRFPTISDPIYGAVFDRPSNVQFFNEYQLSIRWPLVIYCKSPTGELGEQTNARVDTPEYVEKLTKNHELLKKAYEIYFEGNRWGYPGLIYTWNNWDDIIARCRIYAKYLR
jgi:adenylate kinase family enzyme